MSRTLLELAVYALVVGFCVLGFGKLKLGDTLAGASWLISAFAISGSYFYLVKVRPQVVAARRFRECLVRLGFQSFEADSSHKSYAQWVIREHGNTDLGCFVSDLLARADRFGDTLAGDVTESGQGLNFGMFIIGALAPIDESKIPDGDRLSTKEIREALLENNPYLSASVEQAIEDTPLDCTRVGSSYRISFDADDVLNEEFESRLTDLLGTLHPLDV